MKFSAVLCKQHIGRITRRHWFTQCERVPVNTGTEEYLIANGIKIVDPLEIVEPKREIKKFEFPKLISPIVFDNTHPDWKARKCLAFMDTNVLQGGINQALLLTNTVKINDELPQKINDSSLDIPDKVNDIVKRAICTSNIFDAHQEKLPKRKDPERPAFNFPRDLGLTSIRKTRSLSKKLIELCEYINDQNIAQNRHILYDGFSSIAIEKNTDLLLFSLTSDIMITSLKPLSPLEKVENGTQYEVPNIYPLHSTISLQSKNIYKTDDIFPIASSSPWLNVHTIFVYHNPEEVKNLTELPVSDDQIISRSIIKTFTVAASCARQKYGTNVENLPEPLTVQCVLTNGQDFNFSVFQLNTLDISNENSVKNFWWTSASIKLFEKAGYIDGRPHFDGYNPDVFKKICEFYRNT